MRRCAPLILASALAAHAQQPLTQQPPPSLAPQELQCLERGWQREVLPVAGLSRLMFWKAPRGPWTRGAILVMHGGGGNYYNFCVANAPIIAAQVAFTDAAVAQGFAVLLLESSRAVTDDAGRACGKVWDDQVSARPNIDLPFLDHVIGALLPQLRPAGSRAEVFLTGLSSGGYMTVRAATAFDNRVTAFAPVSSGDPYGWTRTCVPGTTARTEVHGVAQDAETGKRISEPGACVASAYPSERPWDTANPAAKPRFRAFHHEDDGVHDLSCNEKLRRQLAFHGYPEAPPFILRGEGRRSFAAHLWQEAYNAPLLEFFAAQLK